MQESVRDSQSALSLSLLISILTLRQIANTDTHLTINNRSAYPCIYVAYNLCFEVRKKDMFGRKV